MHAAGVSFPEVLQTRGEYQMKPPLPFVPGQRGRRGRAQRPGGRAGARPGDRVAAFCALGGFAETAVAPEFLTFELAAELDFAQGAALILNYHTAYFALVLRGRLKAGETVLVHGAAGGVGTAALQVAKGLGARTIAVVSERAQAAGRRTGRRRSRRALGETGRTRSKSALGRRRGPGARPGGRRPLHRQPALAARGRPAGRRGLHRRRRFPRCKVNRLLLKNTEVVGAGWGAYVMGKPDLNREIGAAVEPHGRRGRHPRRSSASASRWSSAAEALEAIDERRATGKVVLDVRAG